MTGAPSSLPAPEDVAARPRHAVLRWLIGQGTFGVPQAAAPIAFGFVALPITGAAESGAAMVFAMTMAQVLGAVPISRLGRRFTGVGYLRLLLAARTAALVAITVLSAVGAPFALFLIAATAAGVVNGAAYGYQRLLLNHLVTPGELPRTLGLAATVNEVTFALAPVLASLLGAVSPVGVMAAITVLGVGPVILIPRIPGAGGSPAQEPSAPRYRIPADVVLWLFCATAGGGAVAAVEVGAVSFAIAYDLEPRWAFLFATALCLGSILGGVWVSVRNRRSGIRSVVVFLAATVAGSGLVLAGGHLALTLTGAAIVGFFLPSLSTFYSLALDRSAPQHRRAELFALLRTANAIGVIAVSGLLALLGLRAALVGTSSLLVIALLLTLLHSTAARRDRRRPAAREHGDR